MSQKPQKKEKIKRNESVVIRVTPETKKRWSDLVYALVSRKRKKYRNAEELLIAMMDNLRESVEIIALR